MTHRERVISAIKHRCPDRVPLDIWATDEVFNALMGYFDENNKRGVKDRLGVDVETIAWEYRWPGFEDKTERMSSNSSLSGRKVIMHEDNRFEDGWGIIRESGSNGRYFKWISGPLEKAISIDEYKWPDASNLPRFNDVRDAVKELRGKYFLMASIDNPFKMAWQLRGMQNLLMDYILNPEFVEALLWKISKYFLETSKIFALAEVDCIGIIGDIAMQDRLLVAPSLWRKFDKRYLKYIISEIKKEYPHIYFFFHSDGKLDEVMKDLIQIGFDIINPIQPECMNPAEIKKLYGDKITMHGTISLQKTLPFGSENEVRDEVINRMEKCGYNGGLIICPSNNIEFNVPVKNIITMYRTVTQYNTTIV